MNRIDHDPVEQQFSTVVEHHRAILDYTLSGTTMTITHTGVPDPIGGRGIAAELMKYALGVAKESGWSVVPACSYAATYMRRHPESLPGAVSRQHTEDLLDEALEESFPASDSPSVGGAN